MPHKIEFEKPDLNRLRDRYTVVDLHFHTRYSDGLNGVPAIVRRVRELGIGIAITDHNQIAGAVEIDRYDDILSVPGIEITSREGTHLLVYFRKIESLKSFFHNDVEPFMGSEIMSSVNLDMETLIDRARDYDDAVIVFPHPYSAVYTGICNLQFPRQRLDALFERADAVEVINSENLRKWNMKSALLGFNLEKGITGGSDGHSLYHTGKVVTYAEYPPPREDFPHAIQARATRVIGKEIHILRKMTSNSFKLRSNIRNCPDLLEKNIRYSCTVINSKSKPFRDKVKARIHARSWPPRRKVQAR